MSHHPERTARNVRPVNQPPSKFNKHIFMATFASWIYPIKFLKIKPYPLITFRDAYRKTNWHVRHHIPSRIDSPLQYNLPVLLIGLPLAVDNSRIFLCAQIQNISRCFIISVLCYPIMKTIFRFPFCDKLTVRVRNPFYTLVVIPIIQNKCSYKMSALDRIPILINHAETLLGFRPVNISENLCLVCGNRNHHCERNQGSNNRRRHLHLDITFAKITYCAPSVSVPTPFCGSQ